MDSPWFYTMCQLYVPMIPLSDAKRVCGEGHRAVNIQQTVHKLLYKRLPFSIPKVSLVLNSVYLLHYHVKAQQFSYYKSFRILYCYIGICIHNS
jgi:hypothetical protein